MTVRKKFIFGGDININVLKTDISTASFRDNILSLGCFQEIEVPTRISSNLKVSSLLDHIYTNLTKSDIHTSVILEDITDHFPIVISLEKSKPLKPLNQAFFTQDFRNFNQEIFLSDLRSKLYVLDSNLMNNESNANETWNRFEEIFNSTVYSHAPLRKMTKKERKLQNKPWLYLNLHKHKGKCMNNVFVIKTQHLQWSIKYIATNLQELKNYLRNFTFNNL